MRENHFSLNIDEATNDASDKKMLATLVSCVSFEKFEVVVGHPKLLGLWNVTNYCSESNACIRTNSCVI